MSSFKYAIIIVNCSLDNRLTARFVSRLRSWILTREFNLKVDSRRTMLALKRCSSFLESSCTFSCPFESKRAVPDRAYVCPYFVSGFLLLKSRTKLEPARLPTSARSSTIFAIHAESTVNIEIGKPRTRALETLPRGRNSKKEGGADRPTLRRLRPRVQRLHPRSRTPRCASQSMAARRVLN